MRTTVNLEPDVEAEVKRLRREESLGLSEAVNVLLRRGIARSTATPPFVQRTSALGARVSLDNIADVLDILDEG